MTNESWRWLWTRISSYLVSCGEAKIINWLIRRLEGMQKARQKELDVKVSKFLKGIDEI